jgi:hypothetical protein
MIKGVHAMFYTSEPDALRSFLRDKLQLHATDVGQGWLIFDLPEAEMGCHPEDLEHGGPTGTHHISLYCDDIGKTVEELKGRGVEFTGEVMDHGYGLVTMFKMPGSVTVQLYQPKYVVNRPVAIASTNNVVKAAARRPTAKKKPAKKAPKKVVRAVKKAGKRRR